MRMLVGNTRNGFSLRAALIILIVLLSQILASCSRDSNYSAIEVRPARTDSSMGSTLNLSYQQVMRTKKIRAAYISYPPSIIKDPNTGELSGIFHDTLEAAGRAMDIDIIWTEEVTWGTMIEGLKNARYDVVVSAIWPTASRGQHANFTIPLYYSGLGAYARYDDHRFDEDISVINSPNIRVATLDGEISQIVAQKDFPQADHRSLPQLAGIPQMLLEVETKKSDVAFVEPYMAQLFMQGKAIQTLRNISPAKPLRIYPNTIMLGIHEPALKSMLDIALTEQLNLGLIEALLIKYTGSTSSYYLNDLPYQVQLQQ